MPGQPRRESLLRRHGGEDRRVAAPAADHDIGARAERRVERLYTRHRDDVLAALEDRLVELRRVCQRPDAPFGEASPQVVPRRLAAHDPEPEVEVVLRGDLLRKLHGNRELRVRSPRGRRADQQRDLRPSRGKQHVLEIAAHRVPREVQLARAEEVGPGIGRAGIAAHHVGLPCHRRLQRLEPEACSEQARRRQQPELPRHHPRCSLTVG